MLSFLLVLLFPAYTSYLVLFLFPLVHIRVVSKLYYRKSRSGVLPLLYRIQEVLGSDMGSEIDYAVSLRTIAIAGLSNKKCPATVLHSQFDIYNSTPPPVPVAARSKA